MPSNGPNFAQFGSNSFPASMLGWVYFISRNACNGMERNGYKDVLMTVSDIRARQVYFYSVLSLPQDPNLNQPKAKQWIIF